MLINLLEIPPEGKTFICNQNTAELNEALRDVIGNIPYQSEFTLRPLQGGTFELAGWIRTEINEDCSRCGLDFPLKVQEKFKELLMPELSVPRTAKYAKVNHVSDLAAKGPDVVEYHGHHFNAGEYIHEVVAIAEPYNPAPECDSAGNCSVCKKNVSEVKTSYEDPGFEAPTSPFASLKGIKLN